ncbi:hypothetical protein Taro_019507 [Colocasia esculenta]|uniref:Uncharacterized protein n=1 Tax=Colocasia esculenta TaxID=4460 RepID=A0A843V5N8_COLES|nr:hypothetical protein [Colocasia esculenta]
MSSLLGASTPGLLPLQSTTRREAIPTRGFHPILPKTPACGRPAHSLTVGGEPRGGAGPLLPTAAAGQVPNSTHHGDDATRARRRRRRKQESGSPGEGEDASSEAAGGAFPSTIPRKPRRGRRSEAAAVEDFVRGSLERTFSEIRKQNPEVLEGKEGALRGRTGEGSDGEEGNDGAAGRKEVVEEEDPDWPADAEVGWGIRASEYFDKHPIRNVVVDGVEIDWEGELEEGWVKEINCLEWESFAFHPSPLIVLVFQRYNRAADNWKLLKELEKAAKVYWSAKDRLPPRTVKIDMNIETDLAYALKVKACPQLLFLRGNRILYREKEMRSADELVQMIAHFYYNAKRPSWIDAEAAAPSY